MVSMKQIFQDYRNGHLLVTDVPVPQVSANRILVKNHFSLVSSGTERQMINPARNSLVGNGAFDSYAESKKCLDTLIPLGYSCAGEVIAVGREVRGVSPGDRVACAGSAYACHAEVVSIPRTLFVKIPETVDYKSAAFAALGGISMQAITLCGAVSGETVVVEGLGLLGLLVVQILKAEGCRVIAMDSNPARCRLAEQVGCDFSADSADMMKSMVAAQTAMQGCDATIVFAAAPDFEPIELAAELTRRKGRVVVAGSVGLGMLRPLFSVKELELHISDAWGPGIYDLNFDYESWDHPYPYVNWTPQRNLKAFIGLLAKGRVEVGKLISHCFEIDSAEQAYKLVATGEKPYAGVLLSYSGRTECCGPAKSAAVFPEPLHPPGFDASSNGAKNIGVGFIGAGNFAGSNLLPTMQRYRKLDLRGVADLLDPSARTVADKFGFSHCTTDYRGLLGDENISSIVIATPHGSHAHIAEEAVKAGKHVLLEIPLAISEDQLRTLVKTYNELPGCAEKDATALDRKILTGFNRRFSPFSVHVKRWLDRSAQPMVINCRVNAGFSSSERSEAGGRSIIGEVCHLVDLIQFITGGSPVRVFAMGMRPSGRFDRAGNVAINIEISDGSVAAVSYVSCGDRSCPGERIEVFRGGLAAVIDDFRSVTCADGDRVWTTRKRLRPDKGYDAEIEAFLGAVSCGRFDLPPFESFVETTLTALAVEKSLTEGTPVRVDAVDFIKSSQK